MVGSDSQRLGQYQSMEVQDPLEILIQHDALILYHELRLHRYFDVHSSHIKIFKMSNTRGRVYKLEWRGIREVGERVCVTSIKERFTDVPKLTSGGFGHTSGIKKEGNILLRGVGLSKTSQGTMVINLYPVSGVSCVVPFVVGFRPRGTGSHVIRT